MSYYLDIVRSILIDLNMTVVPHVRKNSQNVDYFKESISRKLPPNGKYSVRFIHCGSAYEGLAVDVNTDFDIGIQLANPFNSDNFIVERDCSGFFTLQWKSHLSETDKLSTDCDGFVDAATLRGDLFHAMQRAIDEVKVENANIKCKEGHAALTVTVNYDNGGVVSMDWVPQIPFQLWGQCPDLRPLHEMPQCLRNCIEKLSKNHSPVMMFSLAVPDAQKYSNPDQLFNASFSLLEKEFFISNIDLRDMVRLVKLVAKLLEWKQLFGFQSFFAKRIAIKHCEELKNLDRWEGYKTILRHLFEQVGTGVFDGYFIKNQNIHQWEPEEASLFQSDIFEAIYIDPIELTE